MHNRLDVIRPNDAEIDRDTALPALMAVYGVKPVCLSWDLSKTLITGMFKGNLQVMKFVHERSPTWHPKTTLHAAKGHLECLMYAHTHGAPWHGETCQYAARGGHLDCLTFAFENGAAMPDSTLWAAVESGNFACFKFAELNCGCGRGRGRGRGVGRADVGLLERCMALEGISLEILTDVRATATTNRYVTSKRRLVD